MNKRLAWIVSLLMSVAILAGCGGSSHHHATSQKGFRTQYGLSAHSPTFGLPPKGKTLPRPSTAPTLLMLDTVDNTLHGFNPPAVAGYTSGSWPTYNPLAGNYPHAFHVAVMVNVHHGAVSTATRSCLDSEPGDATPSQAGWWVWYEIRVAHVTLPCVYASLSNMPAVIAYISHNGISRSQYFLWDADWTYVYHLDSGYDCTQYSDHYGNQNIDGSACATYFFTAGHGPVGPSPAKVHTWVVIRGKSLHAFYKDGCHSPVLTSGKCGQLAWRVDHFQKLIDTAHGYYPRCFGKRRDLGAAECQIVRRAVAVWTGAVNSTVKAEAKRGCESARGPVHNPGCSVLLGREHHFRNRINHTLETSRY